MNFLQVNGIRLAYRVDGPEHAPVLVMVNSLGTHMAMWDAQVASLGQHVRIVRYDSRGHGASDVPPGPYTIGLLGNDLLAVMDMLGIEQAFVCGLSLGGVVAQWLAANAPERVQRVIFANTAARIGTVESWTTRIDAVKAGGMSAIRDTVVARFLSAQFRKTHPEETQKIAEMVATTSPEGYIGACEALRDADLHAMLASITAPALIIGSELDESTPPAQAHELHAAIAGSELAILPAVAHLSNIEQPETFSQLVQTFLFAGR